VDFETETLESLERLIAAGILGAYTYDPGQQEGYVRFSRPFHRLLMAGRMPDREPGFWVAWLSGDPLVVRAWIEREAAALGPDAPTADAGDGE
jgi:hypothetical protein